MLHQTISISLSQNQLFLGDSIIGYSQKISSRLTLTVGIHIAIIVDCITEGSVCS